MSLQGLPPVQNVSAVRPNGSDLILRVNQRIFAEVIQMSGEQVALSVNGVKVVARLSNPDQAALLTGRRVAQFVVKDTTANQVVLEMVSSSQAAGNQTIVQAGANRLISNLLLGMGIENNAENVLLAGALVSQGLEVTPEAMEELRYLMGALPQWGENEARAAAAFKSAGLPPSQGSIELLQTAGADLGEAVSSLLAEVNNAAANKSLSPAQFENIRSIYEMIKSLSVDWQRPLEELAEQLKQSIYGQGTSLESILLNDDGHKTGMSMLKLLQLNERLHQSGPWQVQKAVENLINSLSAEQFVNARTETEPPGGYYLRFGIPIRVQNPAAEAAEWLQAQLKISYQDDGQTREVNGQYCSFNFSVDMGDGKAIEVSLAVVKNQVGLDIVSTTLPLKEAAEEELPEFKQKLEALGLHVRAVKNHVGRVELEPALDWQPLKQKRLEGVNLEI